MGHSGCAIGESRAGEGHFSYFRLMSRHSITESSST